MLVSDLERVEGHDTPVLVGEERATAPGVATGLGGCRDNSARRLLVLRLVVLGEDSELLDSVPREGVAAASVLTHRTATNEIVLIARAVDEKVGLLGCLR